VDFFARQNGENMPHARRVDANQKPIVAALRQIGATVQPLFRLGCGVPDLLCAFRGQMFLLEVKDGNGELTEDERAWISSWPYPVYIVRSVDEAIAVLTA
jgi:hypothetical protein